MGIGTKPVWKCDVCNHEWLSRDESKPMRCASCKTPYWDKSSEVGQARESMRLKKLRSRR